MLDRPSIVCRVVRPMTKPIAADAGDVLTVWFGHPELTLCVLTPDAETIIRRRYLPDGQVYDAMLHAFLDGKVRIPEAAQRALLSRSA